MAPFLFTDAIINNKPIKVFNNGDMMRDFTYIDDVVQGIQHVINSPAKPNVNWDAQNPEASSSNAPYQLYNIGNSKPVALIDFITCIEDVTGKKAIKEMLPIQAGDVQATFADVSGLQKDFNYTPSTNLKEGIEQFVHWYKNYFKVK